MSYLSNYSQVFRNFIGYSVNVNDLIPSTHRFTFKLNSDVHDYNTRNKSIAPKRRRVDEMHGVHHQ